MIEHLSIDRQGRRTDFVAVGNWRVIGSDTGRLLARHGAHLVHSAPSTGVRDWSDLRIAVTAGVWLGGARPGDVLEIVSDDRAFDAVGDVASTLGVSFRRLSYRALIGVVQELVERTSDHSVLIDTLANALKSRGFRRPPGSPRLITRLRRIKELSVSPTGMITLVAPLAEDGDRAVATSEPPTVPEPVATPSESAEGQSRRRRRGRRGGRRRRRHPTAIPPAV